MSVSVRHVAWALLASLPGVVFAPAEASAAWSEEITIPDPIPLVKRVGVDGEQDAQARWTEVTTDGFPGTDANLPDLLYATLGCWAPDDPPNDPYTGIYTASGGFLRLDLVFPGLLNPPGPVGASYEPMLYGTNPLFGWVEFDMDANEETGGDTAQPELGYNANAARFGGMPQGERFMGRVGTDGLPWDREDFDAVPAIHRSGEEFSLRLEGEWIIEIDFVIDDGDGIFEEGEEWVLGGYFFWRASGYEPLTYAQVYAPWVTIRFGHSLDDNTTTVSFVYPLDNAAHALMYDAERDSGESKQSEPMDFFDWNANSVLEALTDLNLSAIDPPSGTEDHEHRPLLIQWADQDPVDHLNPWYWRTTMLFGTALESAPLEGGAYVWTDIRPNVVVGDFNGDGLVSATDSQMLADFLAQHDADPLYDAGGEPWGEPDGEIVLLDFAFRFSIFDGDYDGLVPDAGGLPFQGPCDYYNDGDVDLMDYQAFQFCFSLTPLDPDDVDDVGCLDAFDPNGDSYVNLVDFGVCFTLLDGPAGGV